MTLDKMASRVRHRAVVLIMTFYQTSAVTPSPQQVIVDGAGGDQHPDKLHVKKETLG